MSKSLASATLTTLLALAFGSLSVQAQTDTPPESEIEIQRETTTTTTTTPLDAETLLNLNRAKNLARMAAERANGGLGRYRAESSMHGPASQTPYVVNSNGTWTFTFQGTEPGETIAVYESVVTVDPSTWDVTMDYNGPVRASNP
jgi:hypothetical protein